MSDDSAVADAGTQEASFVITTGGGGTGGTSAGGGGATSQVDAVVGATAPKARRKPPRDKPGKYSPPEEEATEVWEATTNSGTRILVRDQRQGGWKKVRVSRKGSRKRLTITPDERRHNQEGLPDKNLKHDAFSNGKLVCIIGDEIGRGYSDDDLKFMLTVDDAELRDIVDGLSEVVLRRLCAIAEKKGTNPQFNFLRDVIAVRFRVGGTQVAVAEMYAAGEETIQGFLSQ